MAPVGKSGIQHPRLVDLVTHEADGGFALVLVESAKLVQGNAVELQEKLNTYLSFALDGQLTRDYPAAIGAPVRIRIDLYSQPDDFILEFFRRFRAIALRQAVDVDLSIDQKDVAL